MRWWRRRSPSTEPDIMCQQWVEIVTDYLEGALPPDVQQAADRHLAACPHCLEYLAQMRRVIGMAGGLASAEVPGDVVDALVRAFAGYEPGD